MEIENGNWKNERMRISGLGAGQFGSISQEMKLSKRTRFRLDMILSIVELCVFLVWGATQGAEPGISRRAIESALHTDLQVMREAIDNYTLDHQKPPRSLQDLVDASYIRQIPIDPITLNADWMTVVEDVEVAPGQKIGGIVDLHSSSSRVSTEKTPYNTW